jgi:deoxyribodipyrimidine photo-lyase
MNKISLYIFTRDLRLNDNIPLNKALKESKIVIPIFIFNPKQIDSKNKYKSDNCVQFMCESLDSLDKQLNKKGSRLFYFYDDPKDILSNLIIKLNLNAIYISKDYTQFASNREDMIQKLCDKYKIKFVAEENHMLTSVSSNLKDDGTSYVKFTPYYRSAKKIAINKIENNNKTNYFKKNNSIIGEYKKSIHSFYKKNDNVLVHGGLDNAIKILKDIKKHSKYNTERDIPSTNGTTHLSAYLKFGVVSVREVYWVFKKYLSTSNKLFTQLYWRDFYMQLLYYHQYALYGPLRKKYDKIKWEDDPKKIKAWKTAKTGIPIVDAAINEMLTTGYMHNRCRMIVANFLIKILRCNWQIGEQFFANHLIDYDPANNSGGWQWSGSSSTDSQPYFRIFNPWRQMEKFDSECKYVKKWLPQLKDVPNKDILKWNETYNKYKNIKYPKPIVEDIQEEVKKTLKIYEAIFK